ncbi:MAG: hypothetical protein MUE79_07080 [Nitratireductor sp.]|nr:hypothetical protein [Nitratireductor sp.]
MIAAKRGVAPCLRTGDHHLFRSLAKLPSRSQRAISNPAIGKSSFQYFDRLVKITGSQGALKCLSDTL